MGNIIMKKQLSYALICMTATHSLFACYNEVYNDTDTEYKLAEIKEGNKDLKKQVFLPKEYIKDEQKAHTLGPGDSCGFGGHYVPEYMIFKKYPDEQWHSLIIVKQTRCGPRGPEHKELPLSLLLKSTVPDDYKGVYKFTLKKEAQEIAEPSIYSKKIKISNPYQVISEVLDKAKQEVLWEMGELLEQKDQCCPPKEHGSSEDEQETEGECPLCKKGAAQAA